MRGQTLLLFSLTLLLLVLMAMMTLSLGMKIREKIELQTVADAAAYSNAVATARTYNSLAVLNRTEIALNVASVGGQSLISWTTMVRASVGATKQNLRWLTANGPAGCTQTGAGHKQDLLDDIDALTAAEASAFAAWDALDAAAGAAVRGVNVAEAMIQGTGAAVGSAPGDGAYAPRNRKHEQLVYGFGGGPRLVDALVAKAFPGQRGIVASAAANAINAREIDRGGTTGATCDDWLPTCSGSRMNQWEIAMGSRGEAFVTGRGVSGPIQSKLDAILQQAGVQSRVQVTVGGITGSAYWWQTPADIHGADVDGADRHAEDHTGGFQVRTNYTARPLDCVQTAAQFQAWARVHSANMARLDLHEWSGGEDPDSGTVDRRHSLISPIGDGNWPLTTDYNETKLSNAGDLFGQPKNYVLLERDLAQRRRDPWNLAFTFRFAAGGTGQRLDISGRDRAEIGVTRDGALAAGMAYYHRKGDWQEGPNLVNPFWRATLVPVDVDRRDSPGDLGQVLAGAAPGADRLYDQLVQAGFRGVH